MHDWKNRQGTNIVMDTLDAFENTRPIDHKIEVPVTFNATNAGHMQYGPPYAGPGQQPYVKYPKARGPHKDAAADQVNMHGIVNMPGGNAPHGAVRME